MIGYRSLLTAVLTLGLLGGIATAQETKPLSERFAERLNPTVCIWDIVGRSGPIFTAAQDQTTHYLKHGIKVKLVPYTDERVMVETLKAGLCDAALMTGMRARLFNQYTGTIDSIGGLPSEEHLRLLLKVLADPRSAPHMTQGEYVVLGIAPA